MHKNLAAWERMLRVFVGALLVMAGVAVFLSEDAFGYLAFASAAVLIGLDLFVTGAIGYCPLYHALGRRHQAAR